MYWRLQKYHTEQAESWEKHHVQQICEVCVRLYRGGVMITSPLSFLATRFRALRFEDDAPLLEALPGGAGGSSSLSSSKIFAFRASWPCVLVAIWKLSESSSLSCGPPAEAATRDAFTVPVFESLTFLYLPDIPLSSTCKTAKACSLRASCCVLRCTRNLRPQFVKLAPLSEINEC